MQKKCAGAQQVSRGSGPFKNFEKVSQLERTVSELTKFVTDYFQKENSQICLSAINLFKTRIDRLALNLDCDLIAEPCDF